MTNLNRAAPSEGLHGIVSEILKTNPMQGPLVTRLTALGGPMTDAPERGTRYSWALAGESVVVLTNVDKLLFHASTSRLLSAGLLAFLQAREDGF